MEDLVLFGAALWLFDKLRSPAAAARAAVKAIERGGAAIYESTLMPEERDHRNDLPGHQLTRPALLDLATRAGFPDPKLAVAIALAESGGVPNAILRSSREYSVGLWQINTRAWPQFSTAAMADPGQNALAAMHISKGGTDWRPWSTYNSGAYKRYL
jgi:Lysozyme like domain